jgi:aconitate hydratase
MGYNLARKIIAEHLVAGEMVAGMVAGKEVAIRVDQAFTHDLAVMAWQQFESMGMQRVRTELAVDYTDHNTLQTDFRNADDHRYLQSVAAKYGAYFSRPGNGICHQLHLERFAAPGKTLVGTDSHTPTAGGVGSLAVGVGGMDVAVALGGSALYLTMPEILGVKLVGSLQPWVTAKDVVLELLRRLTVKGGVGKILEYCGPGVPTLSVTQRATICNMGTETGATTSLFPSDEVTRDFLEKQGRGEAWRPLAPDADASYDESIEIDLGELEPLIAQPHSPDNVVKVSEIAGAPVNQVCVGSCTNSSYEDLMAVAAILKGKTIHPSVSFTVSPGTKQVYSMIAENGALADLIAAGARILESACGPCIGMGQAPASGGVSIRSFNRNFKGRSGTPDARLYLASPQTCAAAALFGVITDPRKLGGPPVVDPPLTYRVNDNMIVAPAKNPEAVEVVRGPNIRPMPIAHPVADVVRGRVLLKAGDNITTEHVIPGGNDVTPLRSNIPAISEYCFAPLDPAFASRAKELGGGFVVGGANYGQGSSREHAAIAPMFLGVKAIIAKSFARIHQSNLVNMAILPLTFVDEADYDTLNQLDELEIAGIHDAIQIGKVLIARNLTRGGTFQLTYALTKRQVSILLGGGLLNYIKDGGK